MERSGDVAPAHLNRRLLPLPEIARPLLRPIAGDNAAVAPQARAGGDCLDHGLGRAARHVVTERKVKFEVVGVWQSALQMRCKAVTWRHVEADSRQQHNASRPSFGVPSGEGLEDVNLA